MKPHIADRSEAVLNFLGSLRTRPNGVVYPRAMCRAFGLTQPPVGMGLNDTWRHGYPYPFSRSKFLGWVTANGACCRTEIKSALDALPTEYLTP